ncbi:MAG: carboxypeptidase regulatory-like domain-containing protein [Jiangellaceae bacterium]
MSDAGAGDPIAGATVTVTGEVDRELVTGADGTFSVLLPVGDYTVSASAFGYDTQTATATVATDETTTQDFALEAQPTVTLSGQIRDGSGHGWPMYANVTVQGVPDVSDYTNPVDGRYSLRVPANATYTLAVESQYPGYLDLTETAEVGGGNATHDMQVIVDPAACTSAPGYRFGSDGVFEPFDAETVPQGWTVVDNVGNNQVWRFDDPGERGNLTGGAGGFAVVDNDFYGPGGSQNTSLVSPVIDLSDVAEPVIRFNQDYNNFGTELADVDLSVDGGATWQTVLSQTGVDLRGPRVATVPIPPAGGQPDVQVRFHYHNASFEWWWEVDNVLVGTEVICAPVNGGLVIGHVRDDNTNAPVNGATVTSVDAPEDTATTFATPDDPGRADGFYWMFSSLTGRHRIAATAGNYTDQTRQVNVQADWATQANFRLGAGQLEVDPTSVQATIPLGGSAERGFTITNTGTAPASVELSERSGSFEILRADGSQLSEQDVLSSAGAAVRRVEVDASLAELSASLAPSRMGTATEGSAAQAPSAPPWTNLPNLPRTVMENNLVFVDGTVYSLGGSTGSASLAEVYALDVATQAWTRLADMPGSRHQAVEGLIDGLVYLASGWFQAGQNPTTATTVYDPATDSWTNAAAMPGARAAAGSAVVDGQLYVVGGCTTSACAPYSSDVFRYDPGSDTWETLADYPELIAWESCGAVRGLLYCAGGLANGQPTTNAYAYDPSSDDWMAVADMPANLWGSAYVGANDQLLINGGLTGPSTITNQGFTYNPADDVWSPLPASNHTLFRAGSACGFYKVGGSTIAGFTPSNLGEVLPGFEDCGLAADVPWLSVAPTTATLEPGDSVAVTVAMDANVAQPGTYTAGVGIAEDTPHSVDPVGVTMNVTPPASWGKIAGTVDGIGCDGTRSPIAGAVVQIDSWAMSITLITEADGTYAHWLDRRNNPLTVIVAKDDFQPQTRTTRVVRGETVTENFALRAIC